MRWVRAEFGDTPGVNFGWYLTDEGSLPGIGLNQGEAIAAADYLQTSMTALHQIWCVQGSYFI